jgi:hypothetical protein
LLPVDLASKGIASASTPTVEFEILAAVRIDIRNCRLLGERAHQTSRTVGSDCWWRVSTLTEDIES